MWIVYVICNVRRNKVLCVANFSAAQSADVWRHKWINDKQAAFGSERSTANLLNPTRVVVRSAIFSWGIVCFPSLNCRKVTYIIHVSIQTNTVISIPKVVVRKGSFGSPETPDSNKSDHIGSIWRTLHFKILLFAGFHIFRCSQKICLKTCPKECPNCLPYQTIFNLLLICRIDFYYFSIKCF